MQLKDPQVAVGILFQPTIEFCLTGDFSCCGDSVLGTHRLEYDREHILWNGELYDELVFEPKTQDATFLLKDVLIGIGFHWQRREDQRFQGSLVVRVDDGQLAALNYISVEDYLVSVISSEMSATSSLNLLKAHAVISRSWLLSQIEKRTAVVESKLESTSDTHTKTEWIRWWDREDHTGFDVCADDHCQRYQGVTRAYESLDRVRQAVDETRGQLLISGQKIADARFSKCCGGVFERFENCWEPIPHPYLVARADREDSINYPDLRLETEAESWIEGSPAAYCNTTDPEILSQVLNNYDQETADFYRWQVEFSATELTDLVRRKIGIDFGMIRELIPLERGTSGRIVRLKIVGDLRTMILGKELLIRKAFSESHLYSSAFTIHTTATGFRLYGAGWGHGVGLCQIGAAVMAHQGIEYRSILEHYFLGAIIEKKY